MSRLLPLLMLTCAMTRAAAGEPWREALRNVPFGTNSVTLYKDRFFRVALASFKPAGPVKSLTFLPGPTDDLYFKDFGVISLTNGTPNLLEALEAFTNRAPAFLAFNPPHLLVYSAADRTNQLFTIHSTQTAAKLRQTPFKPDLLMQDWDWDRTLKIVQPVFSRRLKPVLGSEDSWHFYRAYTAAAGLTEWELIEALAYATKTKVDIEANSVQFHLRAFREEDADRE